MQQKMTLIGQLILTRGYQIIIIGGQKVFNKLADDKSAAVDINKAKSLGYIEN